MFSPFIGFVIKQRNKTNKKKRKEKKKEPKTNRDLRFVLRALTLFRIKHVFFIDQFILKLSFSVYTNEKE